MGDSKISRKVKFTQIIRIKTFLGGTNSGGVKTHWVGVKSQEVGTNETIRYVRSNS